MATSLSVVLPVHNAQAKLVPLVSQLLEVLPELTPHWDILIVDDGSTDATSEVAHDLARHYPQVHLLSLPRRLGAEGALRPALRQVSGELVLFRSEDSRLDLRDIHKLWRRIGTHDVIVGRAASAAPLGWLPRLPSAAAVAAAEPELQLIRRRILEGWRKASGQGQDLGEYLMDRRDSRCEVDVREHDVPSAWQTVSRMRLRFAAAHHTVRSHHPFGPNYAHAQCARNAPTTFRASRRSPWASEATCVAWGQPMRGACQHRLRCAKDSHHAVDHFRQRLAASTIYLCRYLSVARGMDIMMSGSLV